MKKNYLILVLCFFSRSFVFAADKFWVGPQAGNWTDGANWSLISGGLGGAGRPISTDAVIFSSNALVNVNISANIYSLQTLSSSTVTLFTSIGSTLTVLSSLRVEFASTLKDSTSANVAFNVIFNGANHATGAIYGNWIFEGGVPLSGGSNNGARFTTEDGSLVTVNSVFFNSVTGGKIIFKKNTNAISSTAATLKFAYGSTFVLDNNLNAAIPLATWAKDSVQAPNTYSGFLGAPASTIQITGNIGQLQFLGGVPNYGRMVIDLYALTADANLALPDGSKIRGNLEILNTNNFTLTLLAGTSATSSVQVEVGTTEAGNQFGGNLNISGATTKVALAKATASAPATSYKLLVNKSYNQAGGNFSLQDYNNVTGSSTLDIKGDLIQTGGTFITNSTSTSASAKFVVIMDDPNVNTGPSGAFASVRNINMASGTIDNARHMVTLRIDHTVYSFASFLDLANGVLLQSPLEVGRLELVRSPLTTSASNIITISDPGVNAVTVGNTGKSYVNGPIRRATNSNQSYLFPTGKGNSALTTYIFDSCSVIPAFAASSVYQAEYFKTGYASLNVTAPLKGVENTEYWDIAKISGSDARVKLNLIASVGGAAAKDGIVVAHYVNGHWISEHGSVLTPGNVASGSVLSKQLSSFGSFTPGYADPANLNTVTGGLSYKFYQGSYNNLPDFNALTPLTTGNSSNVNIGVRPAGIDDGFAFIWQGYITIPSAGTYTFETVSDDGSKLYFNTPYNADATALVNNDGIHAAQSVAGTVNIPAAGIYPVTITFFENYGGEAMQVYWSGPGIPRQLIPDVAFKDSPQPSNGLSYKFYQGSFSTLPDFSTLTPVKTGTSNNVDISVKPAGVNDEFAFVWQGYINIPAPGNYTFETNSDDGSKLYFNTPYSFNATALVNNDGTHPLQSASGTVTIPAAGWYPITITFFDNYGGEAMQVYWSGPGFARQQIPDAAFSSDAVPPVSGLNYKYYEGDFNALPDYTTLTPVKTGVSANVDISVRTPGVNDHYAFIWSGYINLPAPGTYTLETISDDGSKVYFNMPYSVNGSSTVNNDGLHAAASAAGTVTVADAGRYPFSATFFEKDGGETMQLYWSGPGISRQLVPDAAFTTTNNINANGIMSAAKAGSLTGSMLKDAIEAPDVSRVYPNPFVESFTIDYYNSRSANEKVTIRIYDLNGKLMYNYQPDNLMKGYNKWMIQPGLKNMNAGVYMAQLNINGVPVKTVTLIKIK